MSEYKAPKDPRSETMPLARGEKSTVAIVFLGHAPRFGFAEVWVEYYLP